MTTAAQALNDRVPSRDVPGVHIRGNGEGDRRINAHDMWRFDLLGVKQKAGGARRYRRI